MESVSGGLVPCPANCKNGQVVTPKLRKQDGGCPLCHGVGMVSPLACYCGRTRRLDAQGYVSPGVFSCGRKECKEKLAPTELAAEDVTIHSNQQHNRRAPWYGDWQGEGSE